MEITDRPRSQRKWDREEAWLLVSEYFRTKALSLDEKNKSYEFVSKILRSREIKRTNAQISDTFRNIDGIRMQTDAVKSLDPDTPNNGMHATKLLKQVVHEYLQNPAAIKAEAYDVILKYTL